MIYEYTVVVAILTTTAMLTVTDIVVTVLVICELHVRNFESVHIFIFLLS